MKNCETKFTDTVVYFSIRIFLVQSAYFTYFHCLTYEKKKENLWEVGDGLRHCNTNVK